MGIKGFSKIFTSSGEVKLKKFKNMTFAIDGFVMGYQSALGMRNINALTDSSGIPTLYINVIISKIINFSINKINQVWVFDYDEGEKKSENFHNPTKMFELAKRSKRKDVAKKKIKELESKKIKKNEELFSDTDDEDSGEIAETNKTIDEKIQQQERAAFSMNRNIINDIKFILNCLNIAWCDAPKGYEAEEICAMLTDDEQDGFCDVVYTTDTDAIVYGAKQLVRPDPRKKKLFLYELDKMLSDNKITMDDLRKVAVVSGCDHCPKTQKIGPKTVLRKLNSITLTPEQKKAIKVFQQTYDLSKLKWHNETDTVEPFSDATKHNLLLDWLVNVKSFNKDRIKKQLLRIINKNLLDT